MGKEECQFCGDDSPSVLAHYSDCKYFKECLEFSKAQEEFGIQRCRVEITRIKREDIPNIIAREKKKRDKERQLKRAQAAFKEHFQENKDLRLRLKYLLNDCDTADSFDFQSPESTENFDPLRFPIEKELEARNVVPNPLMKRLYGRFLNKPIRPKVHPVVPTSNPAISSKVTAVAPQSNTQSAPQTSAQPVSQVAQDASTVLTCNQAVIETRVHFMSSTVQQVPVIDQLPSYYPQSHPMYPTPAQATSVMQQFLSQRNPNGAAGSGNVKASRLSVTENQNVFQVPQITGRQDTTPSSAILQPRSTLRPNIPTPPDDSNPKIPHLKVLTPSQVNLKIPPHQQETAVKVNLIRDNASNIVFRFYSDNEMRNYETYSFDLQEKIKLTIVSKYENWIRDIAKKELDEGRSICQLKEQLLYIFNNQIPENLSYLFNPPFSGNGEFRRFIPS